MGNAIEIKERLKSPGKQVRMLLAELMLYCEKRQKEVGVRITQLTSNKYYRLCRYLHEYTRLEYKKEDIRLTEVTYGYLDGFNTFLQTGPPLPTTTVPSTFWIACEISTLLPA